MLYRLRCKFSNYAVVFFPRCIGVKYKKKQLFVRRAVNLIMSSKAKLVCSTKLETLDYFFFYQNTSVLPYKFFVLLNTYVLACVQLL